MSMDVHSCRWTFIRVVGYSFVSLNVGTSFIRVVERSFVSFNVDTSFICAVEGYFVSLDVHSCRWTLVHVA